MGGASQPAAASQSATPDLRPDASTTRSAGSTLPSASSSPAVASHSRSSADDNKIDRLQKLVAPDEHQFQAKKVLQQAVSWQFQACRNVQRRPPC